jgi:hypothetical protein
VSEHSRQEVARKGGVDTGYVDRLVELGVALQVVLPGLKSLISGIRGWDVEERAARVVASLELRSVELWPST